MDKPLNCDRDAARWAREFLEVIEHRSMHDEMVLSGREPLLDEGLLIAWFANAMMCGEDTYRWRQRDTLRRRLREWETELLRGGPLEHLAPAAIQALRAKLGPWISDEPGELE